MRPRSPVRPLYALTFCFALFGLVACQPIMPEAVEVAPAQTDPSLPSEAVATVTSNASGDIVINPRADAPAANFVRVEESGDLLPGAGSVSPEEKVLLFLEESGAIFGEPDPKRKLELMDTYTDQLGVQTLTFVQLYDGVEVFGSEIKARFSPDGELTSVNGFVVAVPPDLDTAPSLSADEAAPLGLSLMRSPERAGAARSETELEAISTKLYIFQKGLAQGMSGEVYLVYEVEVANATLTVHEYVYVDAHTGGFVDQITGRHEMTRRVYDREFSRRSLIWKEGDSLPHDLDEINMMLAATENAYNLFAGLSGGTFLSWDSEDGPMESVYDAVDFADCENEPGAFWSGEYVAFCPGMATDDVVAHEWAHAYTESKNGLIYLFQPGALNESYSDIFGEIVDRVNATGLDAPDTARTGGSCSIYTLEDPAADPTAEDSQRWLLGEETISGVRRDMWTPTCLGDPGKVTDPEYHCGGMDERAFDSGGVHTNSGIPNHAFTLLVDGGDYNSVSVRGIGLTKAAHIYWRAATMQTQLTDFPMHAQALRSACSELVRWAIGGLEELNTDSAIPQRSREVMTADDCAQVDNVIRAVELEKQPEQCPNVIEPEGEPTICGEDQTSELLFASYWEYGADNWGTGTRAVGNPAAYNTWWWYSVDDLPDDRENTAMYGENLDGSCEPDEDGFLADDTGITYLEGPIITLPSGTDDLRLSFIHWIATEYRYDGGNLKLRVNDGPWQEVPLGAFLFNGYNVRLAPARGPEGIPGNRNPLAGQWAFSGATIFGDGGNWGETQLSLVGIAAPGDTLQVRFELGQDQCLGFQGWYVDDVELYACTPN